MPSGPLDSTHGRTTSGVAFHHGPLKTHTVEQRRAWHAITALGRRRAWYAIISLEWQTHSNDVGGGMPSPLLDNTHGRTTSGVACHHRHWEAHTVEKRRAWHDITAFGLHARSDDVGRGMTSPPLDSTHGWQRRAWHDITAVGQNTRSATSGVA